jgi:hypothetical protein
MTGTLKIGLSAAVALICIGGIASAQEREHGGPASRPAAHGEPHPGPRGYERAPEPRGWNTRPKSDDDDALLVNIQTGEILQVEYGIFG